MCLFCKKGACNCKDKSCLLMYGSILSVVAAVIGSLGFDLWLASTQWLLISIVLATWAVFTKE